jgi:hypothetical protein
MAKIFKRGKKELTPEQREQQREQRRVWRQENWLVALVCSAAALALALLIFLLLLR